MGLRPFPLSVEAGHRSYSENQWPIEGDFEMMREIQKRTRTWKFDEPEV